MAAHVPAGDVPVVEHAAQFVEHATRLRAQCRQHGIELEQRYPEVVVPAKAEQFAGHDAARQIDLAAASGTAQAARQRVTLGDAAVAAVGHLEGNEAGILRSGVQ